MRIAIVSDIHANLTAFEAVLSDLDETSPDLIMHGGDLADGGANGAAWSETRTKCWRRPRFLRSLPRKLPELKAVWTAVHAMAEVSREDLGDERLDWLRGLPELQTVDDVALVHATPSSRWEAPYAEASEEELDTAYGGLGRDIVVYGHIHVPFVRTVGPASTRIPMSLSLRSCTRLTRWRRLRPRRSSLQTTITSPCRAALRKAARPGAVLTLSGRLVLVDRVVADAGLAQSIGNRGRINARDIWEQMNSCSCLTLIVACIIYWQAKDISRVIRTADPDRHGIDLSLLRHVSPIEWDNIVLYGEYVLNRRLIRRSRSRP